MRKVINAIGYEIGRRVDPKNREALKQTMASRVFFCLVPVEILQDLVESRFEPGINQLY
jgi:hypothetical protein